jgi:hypothetical protein
MSKSKNAKGPKKRKSYNNKKKKENRNNKSDAITKMSRIDNAGSLKILLLSMALKPFSPNPPSPLKIKVSSKNIFSKALNKEPIPKSLSNKSMPETFL